MKKEQELQSGSNFKEASKIRAKITEFEQLKIYKAEHELKQSTDSQINQIRKEKENELQNYKEMSNQQKNEIKEKAEQMVKEMKERHQKELDEYKELFESNWPKNNPTSTKEMLEIEKKMNVVISKKQFMSAQQYQDKLNDLKEKNDLKWNTEIKEKKLNAEIKKITTKQNNELNALYQKINSINNEFDAKQNKDIAIIEKKYNNKERDYLNEAKRKTDQIILSSRKVIHKNEYN